MESKTILGHLPILLENFLNSGTNLRQSFERAVLYPQSEIRLASEEIESGYIRFKNGSEILFLENECDKT
jgi:hypothetical protein